MKKSVTKKFMKTRTETSDADRVGNGLRETKHEPTKNINHHQKLKKEQVLKKKQATLGEEALIQ